MKTTTNRFFISLITIILFWGLSFSQENARPMYVTMTTMYWNNESDMTNEEWAAGEKEYMEKVTNKNEHIMWAGYATHLMTPNSNEVIYAQTYASWDAIEKAADRSAELEKEAWPDEATRREFLSKMNSAYKIYHSDEIYATVPGAKQLSGELPDGAIVYMRKNKRAFPKDGSWEEYNNLNKKMLENVINKNEHLRAYYPSQHAYGSDRRDFIEIFYLNSLADLDKAFEKNQELTNDAFTEEEREAMGKYFSSHGDFVYSIIKL